MSTRIRRELEPKWVSWYVAKTFPRSLVKLRCPLGSIPEHLIKAHGEAKAIRIHRPWRPEVDACVVTEDKIVLVEAKIQKFMDGLSKLPIYKSLVPLTPELTEYKEFPAEMVLLMPAHIGWVEEAAERAGVKVVVEAPEFIKKAWGERDKYWTKPEVEKREKRKKTLRKLGYE